MNSKNIKRLFSLADEAKDRGFYTIANMVFAIVYGFHFGDATVAGIGISWETTDPRGENYDEAYYDLAVMEFEGQSLNIPIPLLWSGAAVTLLKNAEVVERRHHGRTTDPFEGRGFEEIMADLLDIMPAEEIRGVAPSALVDMAQVDQDLGPYYPPVEPRKRVRRDVVAGGRRESVISREAAADARITS